MKKFNRWRAFFWPIHRGELKKILPMLLIFFLISFCYNILRSYKDTIIVTASHSGAEAIPFIKVWVVFPSAILMTFLFTRLSNALSREKVFYIILSIFLVFFFLFAFFLYPSREALHPHDLADRMQAILPGGCKGLIAIFRNWTFTLFYVMSELWSTTILSLLFWGFANEVTTVGEAKRFYGILGMGGNLAGVFSGQAAVYFSGGVFLRSLPYGKTSWDQSIFFLTIALLISGVLILAVFRWLTVRVIRPSEACLLADQRPEKIKMSMRQNFLYLARSKYLICIALIVVAYNLVMNLVEVIWKDQMKMLYPCPNDYNRYMGEVMSLMAVIATIAGLAATNNAIRRYSWTACAMIAPIVIGVSGILFFVPVIFHEWGSVWISSVLGIAPLTLSVTLGSMQNCLSRASKYTVFDATKEIAFIPLSYQSKLKGKAAIDGIGSRLGKSGGSAIHQGLIIIFSTLASSTPVVAVIFLGVIGIWSAAVFALGKQFDFLTAQNAKIDVSDIEAPAPAPANEPA